MFARPARPSTSSPASGHAQPRLAHARLSPAASYRRVARAGGHSNAGSRKPSASAEAHPNQRAARTVYLFRTYRDARSSPAPRTTCVATSESRVRASSQQQSYAPSQSRDSFVAKGIAKHVAAATMEAIAGDSRSGGAGRPLTSAQSTHAGGRRSAIAFVAKRSSGRRAPDDSFGERCGAARGSRCSFCAPPVPSPSARERLRAATVPGACKHPAASENAAALPRPATRRVVPTSGLPLRRADPAVSAAGATALLLVRSGHLVSGAPDYCSQRASMRVAIGDYVRSC